MLGLVLFLICFISFLSLVHFVLIVPDSNYWTKIIFTGLWGLLVLICSNVYGNSDLIVDEIETEKEKSQKRLSTKDEKEKAKERTDDWGKGLE